ncbi:rod-binding protein [Pseudoduganella umbonata]|uniref:Flagellar biosynthesis protein FlgJ n=1 Tax=Pseudoduganella umbonata TaxID=864828 RepID=A0A4P8HNH7_9BURK|nr:rod-binding protein [Pseudoduganella umbonata]MBB3221452.1 flagellar protein FlgJ [Pseudoduganella umbonata]QCP10606.1 flagellar biosynthesis protein FlgJ [Pseudoduganella umbonata]
MDPRLTSATPAGGALGLDKASSALPQAVAPNAPDFAAAGSPDSAYKKKASEAAVKFEAFFIGHMLKQMRSSTKELAGDDSIYKDSINSDMLDMADNLVADQMANQRAFGIADAILRQLLPAAPAPLTQPAPAPASPSAQNISTKS